MAAAGIDPVLAFTVTISLLVLLLALAFRRLHQPSIVAFIIAGAMLGPFGFRLVTEPGTIAALGNIGVVLLLFFLGLEVSLPQLVSRWRIPIGGTILQIGLSVLLALGIGALLDWPLGRSLLVGFVVSLSSTAVVLKLLEDRGELGTRTGQDVLGVLLAQDLAIAPMIVLVGVLGGAHQEWWQVPLQVMVAAALIALVTVAVRKQTVRIPFAKLIKNDHELQLFGALVMCFGLALLTGMVGLSPALGAFVAGILVSSARETAWVRDTLHQFKVLFVSLFFVSVGMLIDLPFLVDSLLLVLGLALLILVVNTLLNAGILRALGEPWRESLYFGSILSQVGEFSFVLTQAGLVAGLISGFGYQLIVSVIAVTLLLSPLWISGARAVLHGPRALA